MKSIFTLCIAGLMLASMAQERPRVEGDLSLARALELAQANNLMVRASEAETRAARANSRLAASRRRPQLMANTFLSTGNMSSILTSPEGAPLMVPSDPFADQNLMLVAPLYTGGRLESQVRSARRLEEAAAANTDARRAETALMVYEAYFQAQLAEAMVAAQTARLEAQQAMAANARARFEAGRAIEAEARRAEAEVANARRELTAAENDRAKMLLELNLAMGVQLDSAVRLTDPLAETAVATTLEAALETARDQREELRAARARVLAARADVDAALGMYRPQINAVAMADAFSPADMGRNSGYTLGITLSLPLVDGGSRRADTDRMRAMLQMAEAERDNSEQTVALQVRQSWLDLETARRSLESARAEETAAQAAFDVISLRVESGRGLLVEQLDALSALTEARANVAQSLFDHTLAAARMRRATGELRGGAQ